MRKLPPLPPSDPKSISKNVFDGFYKKGARDFWGDNAIEEIEIKEPKKCDHYFEKRGKDVQCKNCHIGWMTSDIEVEDGVLYVNKKQVNI